MCGLVNDATDFITSSVKEIASHPLEAAGAALGVPGFDPLIGGLFNSNNALISPTGNFTTGAWNDMYNANPGNSGLGLFNSLNQVADKVAPAVAGGFAAGGGLGSALGGSGAGEGTGAALSGSTFATGLGDSASTLGGLEGSLGGAGLFGASAGTGTAIGSAAAQGLGAGGLGIAGGNALGGVGTATGSAAGAFGEGSNLGTGLGNTASLTGGSTGAVPTSGGAFSTEGSQAAPGATANGASGQLGPAGFDQAQAAGATASPDGGNLSTLYGPSSPAPAQPANMFSGMNTTGISPALNATAPAATGNMDPTQFQGLSDLFRLFNTGYGAYQQHAQQQANNAYTGQINNLFSPNSPYAQQMQQTLARQDAAAGRNSQYGTRATQLAAALTQAQANALGNSNYAHAATQTPGANMLNTLFSQFGSPQGIQSLGRLGTSAFNGISSLFGG